MKRINSKKELPKSFDLKKYDAMYSMSDKDLFRQLCWRWEYLTEKNEGFPDYGLHYGACYPPNPNYGDPFNEIDMGEYSEDHMYAHKTKPKILSLSHGGGIRAVSRFDISEMARLNSEAGYWKGNSLVISKDDDISSLFPKDDGMLWAVMSEPVSLINKSLDQLYIAIDLDSPDEALIHYFSKLLISWRKELGKGNPPKAIGGSWDIIKRKILDYRVIPMIDLISWAMASGNKITNNILAASVFPDGERGSYEITQTIKPFIDKLMRPDSLDKINRELNGLAIFNE